MSKTKTIIGGNMTIASLLQIVFIVLKLCKVITWNWVFVLMPLIVVGGIALILLLIALITFIIGVVRKWKK